MHKEMEKFEQIRLEKVWLPHLALSTISSLFARS